MLAILSSVGSLMDFQSLMVYPQMLNEQPDRACGVHIDDCDGEWFAALSDSDRKIVEGLRK